MAKSTKKVTNIDHYRRRWTFNIGIIIFGIFFLYLVVRVLIFFTDNHVTAYEVREGSIVSDTSYTGFAIRDEALYNAQDDGYITYFATEGSKVGSKTNVYAISPEQLTFPKSTEKESRELSASEQEELLSKAQTFSENFSENQFADVYTLKTDLSNILNDQTAQNRQDQLSEMQESGVDLTVYPSFGDGVIYYETDGYESITPETITADLVNKTDYSLTSLKDQTQVHFGDSVYKLIQDDAWTLAILVDEKMAKELADYTDIPVRFSKDNETATASLDLEKRADGTYAFLTFQNGMVRYAQDRYVDIELILEDESGFKIPKSSVVQKKFYLVPEAYLTQGGDSSATGVLLDTEEGTVFTEVTVYYRDTKSGTVYLNTDDFSDGATLHKPDSEKTLLLDQTEKLKGVYNINKGYAVFKQIHILCESEEYYIVEEGNDYGLANYDRIALNGAGVRENEVIY